jgi:molybdopterin-binding protein
MQQVSGRNKLRGTVTKVQVEGLMAQVELQVGDSHIVSVITRDAVEELGLRVGDTATALIKATEVMIIKEGPGTPAHG